MYVSWSEFISLSKGFYSALIIETDCTCIRTSLDPPLSLSLFHYLSQNPGILSVICMYMNKCDQVTQRVIALEIYLFDFACIRMFLDSYFFLSLCLWMFVTVSSYIITQCRCKYTSLGIRVPHSLFLWMFVSMFGPFVTDWTCICTSPDQRFSLSLSFSVCFSVWVYYR